MQVSTAGHIAPPPALPRAGESWRQNVSLANSTPNEVKAEMHGCPLCCRLQVGREHAVLDFLWCSRHMPIR